MSPKQLTVDGVRISVESRGSGTPCLVLHGFTGSAQAMRPLTDGLDAAVIAPDLVGHGGSDAPPDVDAYRMDAILTHLDAVLDALEGEVPVVVGYSFGARVGLSYAVARPARVRHLVTIGGTAGLSVAEEAASRRAADEALAADIEAHGVEDFVSRWEEAPIFATQHDLPAEVRASIRAGRLANRPVGLANSLRGAGTGAMPPLWDALPTLAVPCTVVAGSLDPKFTAVGERMVELMPDATFESIPGAGHACHIEAPGVCRAVVQQVLDASR